MGKHVRKYERHKGLLSYVNPEDLDDLYYDYMDHHHHLRNRLSTEWDICRRPDKSDLHLAIKRRNEKRNKRRALMLDG